MENLKIKAKNLDQKNEIINLFILLGYKEDSLCTYNNDDLMGIHVYRNGDIQDVLNEDYSIGDHKEITFPELRDMVVLKRNDVGDATHKGSITDNVYYVSSDEEVYRFESSAWCFSTVIVADLKPIEKPMKEYLNKLTDGTYKLVVLSDVIDSHDGLIEIPEGANYAYNNDQGLCFLSGSLGNNHPLLIWQRHTQPEELPFVDDEPSLNDQYAEIEQVRQASITDTLNERQSAYGNFENVAATTQNLMDLIINDRMSNAQREAIHMICSKLARISNGDPNHKDSWHDIAGYATLVERSL